MSKANSEELFTVIRCPDTTVKEEHGWYAFYCTDATASVQASFAEKQGWRRLPIVLLSNKPFTMSNRHDVKEVWCSGQQQVRNIWTNLAVYNLNLWMQPLVELWAWNRSGSQLVNRGDSPWDDPERRPFHANRRKALRAHQVELAPTKRMKRIGHPECSVSIVAIGCE